MDFEKKKKEITIALEELKEDIEVLKKNISEMESILETVNSPEDAAAHIDFDIEKGLKHIEIF